jgi:hypothetical protein
MARWAMVAFVVLMGTGCAANMTAQGDAPRRFDPSLYVKAQQPEVDKVASAMRTCAPADTDVQVTWTVAGDGHVEEIAIDQPAEPNTREHDCIMNQAMRARFAPPANGKRITVTGSVARAAELTQI